MYDTVIFDMDGTLLDTLDDLSAAVNHTLREYNYPQHSKDKIKTFIGNGINRLMKNAVPNNIDNDTFNDVFQSFKEYYTAHSLINTAPFPEIYNMLTALKTKGIKTAIVSNKNTEAVQTLSEHFFSEFISVAIGEKEGIKRKPHPDTVIEAMQLLNAKKALYVGDSSVDSQTAINAGIDCCLVRWGYGYDIDALDALYIIDNPMELLAITDC